MCRACKVMMRNRSGRQARRHPRRNTAVIGVDLNAPESLAKLASTKRQARRRMGALLAAGGDPEARFCVCEVRTGGVLHLACGADAVCCVREP